MAGRYGRSALARVPHRAHALAHRKSRDRARRRPRERGARSGRRRLRDAAGCARSRAIATIARGMRPMCVAATVGTTSTTSSDPGPGDRERRARARRVAARRRRVRGAGRDAAGVSPPARRLRIRADSLVVNPHKWLFVPIDLSVLYVRDPEICGARSAWWPTFWKRTTETPATTWTTACSSDADFAPSNSGSRCATLACRGCASGCAGTSRWRSGSRLGRWGTGAGRSWRPTRFRSSASGTPRRGFTGEALDAHNTALVEAVNATGDAFLSTTRLHGRVALRVAIGNERTTEADVAALWDLLRAALPAPAV
jgi:aromatic-L-amino-acid decarboxylase